MAPLRRDFLTHGERDGQAIFDAIGTPEKTCCGSKSLTRASTPTSILANN
jgi:hypothetical protein